MDWENIRQEIEDFLRKDGRVLDFELEEEPDYVKNYNYILRFRNLPQLYGFYFDFNHRFDFKSYMIRDQIEDLINEEEELVVDCYIEIERERGFLNEYH